MSPPPLIAKIDLQTAQCQDFTSLSLSHQLPLKSHFYRIHIRTAMQSLLV